jgi:hypothetical protein
MLLEIGFLLLKHKHLNHQFKQPSSEGRRPGWKPQDCLQSSALFLPDPTSDLSIVQFSCCHPIVLFA